MRNLAKLANIGRGGTGKVPRAKKSMPYSSPAKTTKAFTDVLRHYNDILDAQSVDEVAQSYEDLIT